MDWEFPTHRLLRVATSCSALFPVSGILGRTEDWFLFKSGFVSRRDPSLLLQSIGILPFGPLSVLQENASGQ